MNNNYSQKESINCFVYTMKLKNVWESLRNSVNSLCLFSIINLFVLNSFMLGTVFFFEKQKIFGGGGDDGVVIVILIQVIAMLLMFKWLIT